MSGIPSEHQEQVSFIHAAKKLLNKRDEAYLKKLLFAIPNGGNRDTLTAGALKMEGVRKGVPDLFFAHPTKIALGLFIEMKKIKGGSVSPEQKEMMSLLSDEGYTCKVAKGCAEAIKIFEDYLNKGE